MVKRERRYNSCEISELLFDEIRTFRKESREDISHLQQVMEDQRSLFTSHAEQLAKLAQIIHGDGNKGLLDRIDALEEMQASFIKKFAEIETREKIRAALLAVVCTICSSLGGIIAYAVSIYAQFIK